MKSRQLIIAHALLIGVALSTFAPQAEGSAAPIVDSFTASPTTATPGEVVSLRIEAHDPDCASTCATGCGTYIRSDLLSWSDNTGRIGPFSNQQTDPSGSPWSATVDWTAPATEGTYTIEAYVADSGGFMCGGRGSTTVTLDVTVSTISGEPPVINVLTAQPVKLLTGQSSDLVCQATDPEGSLVTYHWTTTRGTVNGTSEGTASFLATEPGIAQVTCTATDIDGLTASRTVNIAATDAIPERILENSLINPSSVAVDDGGNVYVVDPPSDQIVVFNLGTGKETYHLPVPGVNSIAVDWSGNLLVGQRDQAVVISPSGALLRMLTGGDFGEVADVAVDVVRRRYAVLHQSGRVLVYEENGALFTAFGSTGTAPDQFESPGGIAFTPTGQIVVADSGHGLVKVFSSDGTTLLRSFGGLGGGAGEFVRLHDVSVRNDGVIFTSDTFQSWVQTFNSDGSLREVLGTYGEGTGQLKTPAGLTTADRFGRLLVTSINSSSLHVLIMDPGPAVAPLPSASISTTALSFSPQPVGTSSPEKFVTLRNDGTAALGLHDVTLQGVFTQASDCQSFLAPGGSCSFRVAFTPTSPGNHTGLIRISTSASTLDVALSGEGFIAPGIVLDPWQLQFSDQWVGTTSDPRLVRVTNTGTLPLDLQGVTVEGQYAASHSCPATLDAGASCMVAVTFSPLEVADSVLGRLSVHSSVPGSPHTTILDGRGTAIDLSSTPDTIDFGSVELGQPSSRPVVLTNTGTLAIDIQTLYLGGTDPGSFEISGDLCSGRRLFLGEQCELTVRYPATQIGTASAEIQIPSNTTLEQDVVFLRATGVATRTGLTISPRSVTTAETGTTDSFTVVLDGQPTAPVIVTVASGAPAEGVLSDGDETNQATLSLQFETSNWNVPQTVTVRGVDDGEPDGNAPYWITTLATSTDTAWDGVAGRTVAATNSDDDTPGITLSPALGLTTSEAGGTAVFDVVLNAIPTDAVSIDFSIANNSEGLLSAEGSIASSFTTLVFQPGDWNVAQTIRVYGVDDSLSDGDQAFALISSPTRSLDLSWNGLVVDDLAITNLDDESASFILENADSLMTSEDGATDSFTIALARQPIAGTEVTFTLASSDSTEGTVLPSSLTFDESNWDTPQTVILRGSDDMIDDGDRPWIVETSDAVSSDPSYSGAGVPDPAVTNRDNDLRGVSISPMTGLVTSEDGTSAEFQIILGSEPGADVTITFDSSDSSEGTVSPASVTFTPTSWDTARVIRVTGVDDLDVDGDQPYTVVTSKTSSADPNYDGLAVADITVTNRDDDVALDDSDGDGIDDDDEDGGPNGGDGNGDGVPDSSQGHVATFRAANGNGFITLVSSCRLNEVAALLEDGLPPARALFPFGLVQFELPCPTASVTLLYHAANGWNDQTTYMKFGPDTPGQSLTTKWYPLLETVFDTTTIAGKTISRARFTLTDGQRGDDTGVDGIIVDQGGPAVPGPVASIPTASEWMLLLLAVLLGVSGWIATGGRMA